MSFEAPNTTPVPDIVFDKLLSELTGNELKVLLYIIRRTYGFGKNADAISLSQFRRGIKTKDEKVLDSGCGLEHNRTILVALASLEKKGYVIANKGQTRSGDSDTTVYKLRFKEAPQARVSERVVTSSNDVVTLRNEGSYSTSPRWLPQVTTVVTSGNPQETVLQQTDSQETVRQESALVAASSPNEHAHAFDENDYHFYGTKRQHLIWNCHNWCAGQHGTCEDYVAAIENGWQEAETGKQAAVKIGVPDATMATNPGYHSGAAADGASGSNGISGAVLARGRDRRDGVELEAPQQNALRAAGAPQTVAIASTPGEPDTSPLSAHTRQSQTSSLQGPQDGATIAVEGSESRASGVTQESILNDWDAVQGQPQSRDARLLKAARDGVRASPTREELAGCRDWLPTTDRPGKPWYRLHGVALWDVIEKLGAYRSYLALSIEPAPLADMPKPKPMDIYTAASLDPERTERNLAKLRAKRLAREAAQQGGAGI